MAQKFREIEEHLQAGVVVGHARTFLTKWRTPK